MSKFINQTNERDIWEVANQLGGYVGPDTEERLARFLMREAEEATKLANRIRELEGKVDGLESDLDDAVEVAFRHGAVEWCEINYPNRYKILSKSR